MWGERFVIFGRCENSQLLPKITVTADKLRCSFIVCHLLPSLQDFNHTLPSPSGHHPSAHSHNMPRFTPHLTGSGGSGTPLQSSPLARLQPKSSEEEKARPASPISLELECGEHCNPHLLSVPRVVSRLVRESGSHWYLVNLRGAIIVDNDGTLYCP